MRSASRIAAVLLLTVFAAAGCGMLQGEQSAGEFADDAALTARVKAALLDNEQVAGTDINVNVFNGEVTLAGYADSEEERQKAIEIAKGVPGVKAVQSTIDIAGGGD